MTHAVTAALLEGESRDDDIEVMLTEVTEPERRQYRAFTRVRAARQYLASRWLLRRHLSRQLDVAPARLPLIQRANRPPALAGDSWELSLSHSHAACLCAVSSPARIGCDIEHQRKRGRDVYTLAAPCFDAAETAALRAADEGRRAADFHRLWTLKEAAGKALGHGLAGGLEAPAFSLAPVFRCTMPPDDGPWTFFASTLDGATGCYSLALAVRAHGVAVTLFRYRPGRSARLLTPDWFATRAG